MSNYPEICPLCKGFAWHRAEPCDCKRTNPIIRVVAAADRLNMAMAEFPDYPAAWSEWADALHEALKVCPGTSTHALAEQEREQWRKEQETRQ